MRTRQRLHQAPLPTATKATERHAAERTDFSAELTETDPIPATGWTQRARRHSAPSSAAEVLRLQRQIGNQKVVRLLAQRRGAQAGETTRLPQARIQRLSVIQTGGVFGDLIELEANENLPINDGYRYKPAEDSETGLKRFWRQKAGGMSRATAKASAAVKLGEHDTPEDKRRRAEDAGFRDHVKDLFASPGEGTFEYVAQYLYDSIEQEALKQEAFMALYAAQDDGTGKYIMVRVVLIEDSKKALLSKMMAGALKKFEGDTVERFPGPLTELAKKQDKALAPDVHEKSPAAQPGLPDSVALGFHGTDGAPSTVTKAIPEGGWGGIKKPKTVPFFRTRYALDAAWNPLDAELNKGAHYRKGKNWDNELLSTVSIATKATPSIKFPFPRGASTEATTWIYATVVEKAFPTFKIQTTVFPEVAVNQVDPDDIIGYQIAEKRYDPALIKHVNQTEALGHDMTEFTSVNNEKFAYNIRSFIRNWQFNNKWGDEANVIAEKAAARIKTELGENQWGIYDGMKISKK